MCTVLHASTARSQQHGTVPHLHRADGPGWRRLNGLRWCSDGVWRKSSMAVTIEDASAKRPTRSGRSMRPLRSRTDPDCFMRASWVARPRLALVGSGRRTRRRGHGRDLGRHHDDAQRCVEDRDGGGVPGAGVETLGVSTSTSTRVSLPGRSDRSGRKRLRAPLRRAPCAALAARTNNRSTVTSSSARPRRTAKGHREAPDTRSAVIEWHGNGADDGEGHIAEVLDVITWVDVPRPVTTRSDSRT